MNFGNPLRWYTPWASESAMSHIKTLPPEGIAPRERFEEIAVRTQSRFKQLGLEPDEVERAIRWARESSELR